MAASWGKQCFQGWLRSGWEVGQFHQKWTVPLPREQREEVVQESILGNAGPIQYLAWVTQDLTPAQLDQQWVVPAVPRTADPAINSFNFLDPSWIRGDIFFPFSFFFNTLQEGDTNTRWASSSCSWDLISPKWQLIRSQTAAFLAGISSVNTGGNSFWCLYASSQEVLLASVLC